MNRNFLALICTATAIATLFAASARAGFVLDDFDDPAEVVSPEMADASVVTEGIGDLKAVRSIRIGVFGGGDNVEGQLDSAISAPSALTGRISRLNPATSNSTPGAVVQSNYAFTPTDLVGSEGNNAFFFDFNHVTSEAPPSLFKILVNDTNTYFVYLSESDLRKAGSFTIVVPFDAFTVRGGAPGLPDYSMIQSLNFELRASGLFGGGPDPLNFNMELDRIRVGRIPEPQGAIVATVCTWIALCAVRFSRVRQNERSLPCLASSSLPR